MIEIEPLLAVDVEDVISAVVVIVILIVSAVSQVMGNKKPAQQPRPRPRPPARPAQAGGGRQDPVASELEEFLRRAAGGRPAGQRPPPQAARPVVAQPVAERAVLAETLDELEEIEPVESVAEHVRHSMGGQRVSPQVGHELGQGVASARSRVEQQLSKKFDHQVGRLASTPGQAATAAALAESEEGGLVDDLPPSAAAGLAAMLYNPANLRQAILLSEILERPEKRWS